MKLRIADAAGPAGAVLPALCCAGTPIIVGALTATGLAFLRKDAILWPLMLVSLAIALWGFWRGWSRPSSTAFGNPEFKAVRPVVVPGNVERHGLLAHPRELQLRRHDARFVEHRPGEI